MTPILRSLIAGGAATFFFFSWIIQLLWNDLITGHIAPAAPSLTYLQAAGLWFLITLLFAWTGIASRPRLLLFPSQRQAWARIGARIERRVKRCVSDWADTPDPQTNKELEAKIKRGFTRWAGVEDDIDWDHLGELIERKIKRHLRDWIDET